MDTENQTEPQGGEDDDVGMEVEASPKDSGRTALLPLDFFQGKELKPGSECKIRIGRLLEGQAEVIYVNHEAEGPSPGEEEPEEADEEMAGYMNE